MKIEVEKIPEAKISVMAVNPGLTAENLDAVTKGVDAVLLIAYATGAVPEILNKVIKKRTDEKIPVFIVSSNYGAPHGILDTRKYESKILTL
jgi:L-asparaginase/Glu-tRNA(Gln) amidotransferase subunit D